MSDFDPLFTSKAGVRWGYREDAGKGATFAATQEVAPILENNQAMASHNDGYSPSREMRRVASIPMTLLYKWMAEEGWDPFSQDPDCQRKLAQKLDDPEYHYLRTAPGRVGDHWKHHK